MHVRELPVCCVFLVQIWPGAPHTGMCDDNDPVLVSVEECRGQDLAVRCIIEVNQIKFNSVKSCMKFENSM